MKTFRLQIKAGLTAFGHDVHTVIDEQLTGSKDAIPAELANSGLITQIW